MAEKNQFEQLYNLNVNEKTEKKNGLTYLSWSFAIGELFKVYPDATYEIKHWDGKPYLFEPNVGFMVETSVTVGEITRSMWLPVMNYRNQALMDATMTDINKAIMRCLTKNIAMFGLGLYIYAGEDLPEEEALADEKEKKPKKTDPKKASDELTGGGKLTDKEVANLKATLEAQNVDIQKLCEGFKVKKLEDIDGKYYASILKDMEKIKEKFGK